MDLWETEAVSTGLGGGLGCLEEGAGDGGGADALSTFRTSIPIPSPHEIEGRVEAMRLSDCSKRGKGKNCNREGETRSNRIWEERGEKGSEGKDTYYAS